MSIREDNYPSRAVHPAEVAQVPLQNGQKLKKGKKSRKGRLNFTTMFFKKFTNNFKFRFKVLINIKNGLGTYERSKWRKCCPTSTIHSRRKFHRNSPSKAGTC